MQTLSKHFILCCSILFCTASVKGQDIRLDVPPVGQESIDWCWAACMEMVLDYHGHTETQINLVSQYLILDGATSTPTLSTYCDGSSPSAADHTLTYTNRNSSNFFPQYADLLFNSKRFFSVQSPYTGSISFKDVEAELNACQPFILFLNRTDSIGSMDRSIIDSDFEHAVVVKGQYFHKGPDEDYLLANDPYNVPRCVGCEVLHPVRILDDPVSMPYSAIHSIRHIFPMNRDTCNSCEDKTLFAPSTLINLLSQPDNDSLLDQVQNGVIPNPFYNSLSSLSFVIPPPIKFKEYSISFPYPYYKEVTVDIVCSGTLVFYFYKDQSSGEILLRRIVNRNCTPFSPEPKYFVPVNGESEVAYPLGTYSITEFLPNSEQYYRIEYKGQTYLSPLYSYGKLGFKPGIMYPEQQVTKVYRREVDQGLRDYRRSLRETFRNRLKSIKG